MNVPMLRVISYERMPRSLNVVLFQFLSWIVFFLAGSYLGERFRYGNAALLGARARSKVVVFQSWNSSLQESKNFR
jgi:hypothetical protein